MRKLDDLMIELGKIPGIEIEKPDTININLSINENEKICVAIVSQKENYVEFVSEFKEKIPNMSELKPFIDYIKKHNYKTNLNGQL